MNHHLPPRILGSGHLLKQGFTSVGCITVTSEDAKSLLFSRKKKKNFSSGEFTVQNYQRCFGQIYFERVESVTLVIPCKVLDASLTFMSA